MTTTFPLVSVIVPIFNAMPFLEEGLRSVIEQDYPNFEIIAVDDGSDDGSLDLVRCYGDRIRLLVQSRAGPAAARNAAIRHSRGSFLAFFDADDYWMPGKLSKQIEYAQSNPSNPIVFGQFAFWTPDRSGNYPHPSVFLDYPERWEIKQPLSGWVYADELLESCIHILTALIPRTLFDEVGEFDENLKGGSDYDFWLRATHKFRAHKMEACLALYRQHPGGVTGTPKKTNYPYLVLSRAIERSGLSGPDGRRASAEKVNERLAQTWLDFAILHLTRGDHALGRSAMYKYVSTAGISMSSVLTFLRVILRTSFSARRINRHLP